MNTKILYMCERNVSPYNLGLFVFSECIAISLDHIFENNLRTITVLAALIGNAI